MQVIESDLSAMMLMLSIMLAIGAGMSVVIQSVINAALRAEIGSAAWAGFASYLAGLVAMAVFALVLRDPLPSMGTISRVPWSLWSGGLFGAFFIGLSILLLPQLGSATFIALLITGQMLASVAFDHYGWMGLEQRHVDLPKIIGVGLLISGVILIRR